MEYKTLYSKCGNYCLEIDSDELAESPDSWKDNNMFLIYDHRQFSVKREGFDLSNLNEHIKDYHIFPVYAYIHSGVVLSLTNGSYPFSDNWDTSLSGCVFISRNEVIDKTLARKYAEGLINTWNTYLSRDVWYYNLSVKRGYYKISEENFEYRQDADLFEYDYQWEDIQSLGDVYGYENIFKHIEEEYPEIEFKDE